MIWNGRFASWAKGASEPKNLQENQKSEKTASFILAQKRCQVSKT